jgi:hypothetical protein
MQIAAHQAEHVVASMRDLGGRRGQHNEQVDINGSIEIALKILRNALKGIAVNLHFGQLPMLAANRGELVQIWTNLLRNAADALHGAERPSEAGPASPRPSPDAFSSRVSPPKSPACRSGSDSVSASCRTWSPNTAARSSCWIPTPRTRRARRFASRCRWEPHHVQARDPLRR